MNLRSVVSQLRAARATLGQIDIVLALIEVDALREVFFGHIPDKEKVDLLLSIVRARELQWDQMYHDDDERSFIYNLAKTRELGFDPREIEKIVKDIREKGEENYEFTRID